jgi:hypothetical protein
MQRQKLITKDGRVAYRYVPLYSTLLDARSAGWGFCIACGALNTARATDALAETCTQCGRGAVYGPAEMLSRSLYHVPIAPQHVLAPGQSAEIGKVKLKPYRHADRLEVRHTQLADHL